MWGISWLAVELFASQEGLSCTELGSLGNYLISCKVLHKWGSYLVLDRGRHTITYLFGAKL